ncbi:MAG: hypothetical protein ACKVOO_08205 [Burkholderiaceae bacterium]
MQDEIFEDQQDQELPKRRQLAFDCNDLPRVPWPYGSQRATTFDKWKVSRADGRSIAVDSLHQTFIYAGVLLGGIGAVDRYVIQAVKRAVELYPWVEAEPVVLPPIVFAGRTNRIVNGQDESFDWETLPRIQCIAELTSDKPARDGSEVFSTVIVVWFQDHFGMPDADVLEQLSALEWDSLAFDWCP